MADSFHLTILGVPSRDAASAAPLEQEVTELFDQLRAPILRYLLSFGCSVHDSEEVVQEVFLSLFRHLQRDGSRSNLRGWLFRVAHNLGLKQRNASRDSSRVLLPPDTDAAQHADGNPNPEEQLAWRQRQSNLLAVVRALPERDRCCLSLRAEGLRYREISQVLGMSLGAVSISLARSLARLSKVDQG